MGLEEGQEEQQLPSCWRRRFNSRLMGNREP